MADDSNYVFRRDTRSSIRLNYQHGLMRQLVGYLIHPDISLKHPGLRIADIGTGTGIWTIELSAILPPETRLDGFDVSAAQYPIREWRPPNVHLHTHDVFSPFPQEHHGQYDVVHMRFMISLLTEENLLPLLENLASLLKPDGFLQWIDVDAHATQAVATSPQADKSATETLVKMIRSPRPGISVELNLPDITVQALRSPGTSLSLETFDQIPMQNRYRAFWNQTQLMACEEFLVKMESDGKRELAAKAKTVVDRLGGENGEFRNGASVDTAFFCIVARKASK